MSGDIVLTGTVKNLGEEQGDVYVMFWEHAAEFRLAKDVADFADQLAGLKTSLKRRKPVTISVRGSDVVSVALSR